MWFCCCFWTRRLFSRLYFWNELHSAGKRDLHFTECREEFVRAETTQTAAAGGGQHAGRLHWYGAVSVCEGEGERVRDRASVRFFFPFLFLFKLICVSNQIKQPENEKSLSCYCSSLLLLSYCSSLCILLLSAENLVFPFQSVSQQLQNPPLFILMSIFKRLCQRYLNSNSDNIQPVA